MLHSDDVVVPGESLEVHDFSVGALFICLFVKPTNGRNAGRQPIQVSVGFIIGSSAGQQYECSNLCIRPVSKSVKALFQRDDAP